MDDVEVPLTLSNLQTPCAVINKDALEVNAVEMLEKCRRLGVRLRPNVKTHKCIEVSVIQTGGQRRCISVSTVKEAEFFADNQFEDILLSTIFTEDKMNRLEKLAKKLDSFHLLLDNPYGIDLLEKHPLPDDKKWSVYIKLDCGNHRSGVQMEKEGDILDLLHHLHSISDKVNFTGLYVHEGHSYYMRNQKDVVDLGKKVIDGLSLIVKRLTSEGYNIKEVVIGSTPTCSQPSLNIDAGVITEFHPGNYIFYDVQQMTIGVCQLKDIALEVATRVKGHYPQRNQLLIDAGFTAVSHDGHQAFKEIGGSFCIVKDHPNLRLVNMHQELANIQSILFDAVMTSSTSGKLAVAGNSTKKGISFFYLLDKDLSRSEKAESNKQKIEILARLMNPFIHNFVLVYTTTLFYLTGHLHNF